jgi:hypothetical protein
MFQNSGWRQQIHLERRFILTNLHGVTYQKIVILVRTFLRISNLKTLSRVGLDRDFSSVRYHFIDFFLDYFYLFFFVYSFFLVILMQLARFDM